MGNSEYRRDRGCCGFPSKIIDRNSFHGALIREHTNGFPPLEGLLKDEKGVPLRDNNLTTGRAVFIKKVFKIGIVERPDDNCQRYAHD